MQLCDESCSARSGRPWSARVTRGRYGDEIVACQRADDERRILDAATAKRQVEAFRDEVYVHAARHQLDGDLRVGLEEVHDRSPEELTRHTHRHG